MKAFSAFTLIVGLFLYLTFIDIYEYPSEHFLAGETMISKSAFYNMKADNHFVLNGVPVTMETFADRVDYVVCINGKIHLTCDLWAWVYYCWELLVITLLCMIWYKLCPSKFYSNVALFGATVWSMRFTYQLLVLLNLVPEYNMNEVSKVAANGMIIMVAFLCFLNKIKSVIYEEGLIRSESD